MKERKYKIELLAPAKDKECAIAAIDCGADAVYIGADGFGARKNAPNTIADLQEITQYAHKFQVKIFVAVNTLLYDDELKSAQELINKLYEIGVDAIIIQDMGILELELPPIALHASTQCHNDSLEKVKFLQEVGFERVILARELSLEEIKYIGNNTSVELESFIHGALCVSYSGQCYMSYAIGGRSANRGECAQPCRKKYSLIDNNEKIIEKNKHLLCLKDFNASDNLEGLIKAGVTSFKIEGRLKDVNYVKNVVSHYRKKLDELIEKHGLERASAGKTISDFEPDIKKVFNRGYCSYFLNGRKKNITSFDSPKFVGEFLGKITQIRPHCFKLNNSNPKTSDGITFFDESKELCGTKIDKIENGWIYPNSMSKLKVGTELYRNYSYEFDKELKSAKFSRKIPVNIEFYAKNTLKITMSDKYGNKAEIETDNGFEPSQNVEQAIENTKKQLSKLGATEFEVENITIEAETFPFIKINEINSIRRQLVEKLQKIREKNYRAKKQKPTSYPQFIKSALTYKDNVTNEKARSFYEKCGVVINEYAPEHSTQKSQAGKEVMETKHCLKYSLGFCTKEKTGKKLTEPLFLVDEKNKKYRLEFDCKNCRMKVIF